MGTQGSSYPINAVFLWTSGPHEAVMNVALRPGASISTSRLGGKTPKYLPQQFPGSQFSFDPGDLISQTLNFGTPSVIEVAVTGPQYNDVLSYAGRVMQELPKLANCGTRIRGAASLPNRQCPCKSSIGRTTGVTADQVGQAVVSATASSRFVSPNFWRDGESGVSYQVQVRNTAGTE